MAKVDRKPAVEKTEVTESKAAEQESSAAAAEPGGENTGAPVAPAASEEAAPAAPEEAADDGMVTVTVPKAFTLRTDHFTEHKIKPGVQKMSREMAEHWYCKANGVEIFEG